MKGVETPSIVQSKIRSKVLSQVIHGAGWGYLWVGGHKSVSFVEIGPHILFYCN